MLYHLKINGKEENLGWCGTGLEAFELKPDESKIVRVSILNSRWEKDKSIQIGFNFDKEIDKEYKTFWSDKLPVDDLIEKELLKE